jgi:DNA-binding protein YbaB
VLHIADDADDPPATLAAINDAHRKVDEALATQMQGMMGGLRIPGLS